MKNKTHKSIKALKNSDFIAIVKMLNIGFIKKHIPNLGIGGGYSVLLNYQSFASNFFSLVLTQLFFSIKYKQNRLLRVGFLEL